ncbi:hypothetical protein [Aureimonas sp. ME7]|uniref:hypothetical protein n=1 Tax=Aureimonas sp. ME7 TaxID=2744252 RepID=UPI0015F45E0C|nr:hypothetical protein [Aureimonas sp. ME7]
MGTSSSSKGSGKDQPLVPPGTDDEPGKKVPEAVPQRFRAFRRSFGKFLRDGERADLRRALGHYARTSTGGSEVGPRRYGSVYAAGGGLYDVLSSLGGNGDGAAARGLAKDSLAGQPLDVVCQRIAEALAPEGADADRIRVSIDEAMLEVLGEGDFDPNRLDAETIHRIIAEYLSQSVFQDIVEEVGGSWANAPDEARTPEAEAQLLELIRVVVDRELDARMPQGAAMNGAGVSRLMRAAVDEVWREWEAFDE